MSLVLQSSGGGQITIQEPATASNFTQTLPAASGTIITTGNRPAGSVLQVVQSVYSTAFNTSSTTLVDTGLSASITPTSASSKILVIVSQSGFVNYSSGSNTFNTSLIRNSSEIVRQGQVQASVSGFTFFTNNITYLDSPATTSSTTYKTQVNTGASANTIYLQWASSSAGSSTITLMEIAA
jgi:hypothetical protein